MATTSLSPTTTFSAGNREEFPVLSEEHQRNSWIAIGISLAVLVIAYLYVFARIQIDWNRAQYSHGWLIPLFAAALLVLRRQPFRDVPMWHRWVGVGLILLGTVMRVVGAHMVVFLADNLSFVPCVMGIFILVGGLPVIRWSGPAVLFLLFMYPFPKIVEEKIMFPLQKLASICSNVVLVTMGVDSVRDGTVLYIAGRPGGMNVAEQCSGLRMLTIFTALAVAMALLFTDRPWWERFLIVLSAVPIALAVNVFRITLTGFLYSMNVGEEVTDLVFHDLAGWIMMPLALGLLYLEIYLLGKIFVDAPTKAQAMNIGSPGIPQAQSPEPGTAR